MRKEGLVLFLVVVFALLIGAGLYFSFQLREPDGPKPVSFSVISSGSYSGDITERKNYRIHSHEELTALWALIYGTAGPELPDVDFAREEILAVFGGTYSTGGYTVEVTSVIDEGVKRTIAITHRFPGETCMVTQSVTSPFMLVRIPKTELVLSRVETEEKRVCN